MASLSYISTQSKPSIKQTFNIPTDESVGAFLFDISGFDNPFASYPLLYSNFKDNQVQRINNMDEAELLGVEKNGFIEGLLYYHLSQFYDFIGGNQEVYVILTDCSNGWGVLQYLQREVSGKLFHIGIWTSQYIWQMNPNDLSGQQHLSFTSLIADIQSQTYDINGKTGVSTHTMTPVNILLFPNLSTVHDSRISYRHLPDAMRLNCPNVSVFMAQNNTEEVKSMQDKLPNHTPVSAMGLVMGCLSLCGAEESIASLDKCNLNKNEGFCYPEWGVGSGNTSIDSIHRIWANIIASRGYIIPVNYEEVEAAYYLSSDQTLSEGDFGSIANNRVIHKCRRALGIALMPYVNSSHIYSPGTNNLSNTAIAAMTTDICTAIDSVMRNKAGFNQIDGRLVTFMNDKNNLTTDTISLRFDVKPANYSRTISEDVSHDVS